MNHLRYILEEDPEKGRLDRAALELATIQFPDLDPEPYLLAASRLKAQQPLVVEDSEAGVQSARAAGFDVIRVKSPGEVPAAVQMRLRA